MSARSVVGKVLTGVLSILGIATAIPNPYVEKVCVIGYKAVCSFTPISTIICFGLAYLAYRFLVKK